MGIPAEPIEPKLSLDLRGTPCPLNYIRAKLALEGLEPGDWLQLDLDAGEPEEMVTAGLEQSSHRVLVQGPAEGAAGTVRLLVCCHGS